MLVLNVTYKVKDGLREEYYNAIAPLAKYFNTENGCICYKYYNSCEDKNELFLLEKWESKEAQLAHTETEQFASLQALKDKYVIYTVVERYSGN